MVNWARVFVAILAVCFVSEVRAEEKKGERHVILVTIDGLRWQELFGGAQDRYIDPRAGGVRDVAGTKTRFLRDTPEARRETLMPFIWTVVAKQGQIFGDESKNAKAVLTNGLKFSYPGYHELLCGFPDARINSNDKVPNPNATVFEWLNARPGFVGRVAAYGTWDVLPFMLNVERSKLPVVAGGTPIVDEPLTPGERSVNELIDELTHVWHDNAFDIVTMRGTLEHLVKRKPRVLYVQLGETDEWAHMRRYDCYLEAAYNSDRFLRKLWDTAQSIPEMKGNTSLLITIDHGRGGTLGDWINHGKDIEGAEQVWMAVLGPDVPPKGVRENVNTTLGQVAATVAALVGEDYPAEVKQAAGPLPLRK